MASGKLQTLDAQLQARKRAGSGQRSVTLPNQYRRRAV